MAQKTGITKDTPPEIIEQDIAETRQEMSGTVDAIQEKLSAGHLKKTAKEKIRASTVDRVRDAADRVKGAASRFGQTAKKRGSQVMDTVKDTVRNNPVPTAVRDTVKNNPVPIAMMSIGFAWLLYNRRSSKSSGFSAEAGAAVKQKASELAGKAQETAGELTGQFRERSEQYAGKARESAEQISRSAREKASAAKTRLEEMIQVNPVGVLLTAFAVGSLIGFSLPESRKERDVMGPASESLVGKAKETAQKTFQKAQHAAESAMHAAGEEFKKEAA